MPGIVRLMAAALVFAACCNGLHGQNALTRSKASPQGQQPYTAELKITRVQTLADGTTITEESTEIRALDSRNRTLYSNTRMVPVDAQQKKITTGNVDDPVEGTHTTWNSQSMLARVIKLPPQDQRHGCWESDSTQVHMQYGNGEPPKRAAGNGTATPAPPSATVVAVSPPSVPSPPQEDLGTATIQGFEAHGWRTTTEIPAGQLGNDRPILQVSEDWSAPGLSFPLRQVNDDPRSGRTTMEVSNLDLADPPLTTFQPPDGYKVELVELRQVPCPEPGMPWQR